MSGRFHGLEIGLRHFAGAKAARVVHPCRQQIAPHAHDWACLTLHVIGAGHEYHEAGDIRLDGPSAVLHPAGAPHSDSVERAGLETLSIQFDPAWLKDSPLRLAAGPTRCWRGGKAGAAARRLAAAWARPDLCEDSLRLATRRFLETALAAPLARPPAWLARDRLEPEAPAPTRELARRIARNPAWVARSYRAAAGEGLHETLRRRRVEAAVLLLRHSDQPLAQIALSAGFCDQSHMNRGFKALLGRTPLAVRAERAWLEALHAGGGAAAAGVGAQPTGKAVQDGRR